MCIRDYLRGRQIRFEYLLHRPAPSATRLAESVHVPGRSVAKGVLVRAGANYVLAVLPATHRIDPGLLADLLDVSELRIATEAEVERVFDDCEPGAVPPFGRLYGLTTVVDTSLAGSADIVFVANTRHEGIRMRYRDYESVESPMRARFATTIAPKQLRLPARRAG